MRFEDFAATLDYQPMETIPLEHSPDGSSLPEGLVLRHESWTRVMGQPEPQHAVSYGLVGTEITYAAETYEDGVQTTWDEALANAPWSRGHKEKYTGWAWVNPMLGIKTAKALRAGSAIDRGEDPR